MLLLFVWLILLCGFLRPQIRFGDYLSMTEDSESPEPKLILKRSSKEVASVDNKVHIMHRIMCLHVAKVIVTLFVLVGSSFGLH